MKNLKKLLTKKIDYNEMDALQTQQQGFSK